MSALFGVLGLLGMFAGIVMLLYYLVTKRPKKTALIILGISFVFFAIGLSISSSEPSSEPSSESIYQPTAEPIVHDSKAEELDTEAILELSRQSFEEGMKYFNDNEYEKAISTFKNVIEEDEENYQETQNYIKESEILLSQELLEDAKTFFDDENYEEAIKTAERAITLNSDIEEEARPLIEEAAEKYEIILLEKEKEKIIDRMKEWEGTGSARVAVSDVIAMSSFNDGFTKWKIKDPENACYLLTGIGVFNASNSTLHVNPNFVTLICNNRAFNPDIKTYCQYVSLYRFLFVPYSR